MEKWVRLHRCRKCGKFSHAKRKPKKHQRWVKFYEPEFDPALAEGPVYDYQGSILQEDGHFVDCGPFDYWTATYQGYDQADGNPEDGMVHPS